MKDATKKIQELLLNDEETSEKWLYYFACKNMKFTDAKEFDGDVNDNKNLKDFKHAYKLAGEKVEAEKQEEYANFLRALTRDKNKVANNEKTK